MYLFYFKQEWQNGVEDIRTVSTAYGAVLTPNAVPEAPDDVIYAGAVRRERSSSPSPA